MARHLDVSVEAKLSGVRFHCYKCEQEPNGVTYKQEHRPHADEAQR